MKTKVISLQPQTTDLGVTDSTTELQKKIMTNFPRMAQIRSQILETSKKLENSRLRTQQMEHSAGFTTRLLAKIGSNVLRHLAAALLFTHPGKAIELRQSYEKTNELSASLQALDNLTDPLDFRINAILYQHLNTTCPAFSDPGIPIINQQKETLENLNNELNHVSESLKVICSSFHSPFGSQTESTLHPIFTQFPVKMLIGNIEHMINHHSAFHVGFPEIQNTLTPVISEIKTRIQELRKALQSDSHFPNSNNEIVLLTDLQKLLTQYEKIIEPVNQRVQRAFETIQNNKQAAFNHLKHRMFHS